MSPRITNFSTLWAYELFEVKYESLWKCCFVGREPEVIKLTPAHPESLNMNELLQQQKALDANSFQKSNSNQSAFCVKLNSPFLLFQDNKFWNTKITGVISEKINCSMCNCRLIACPLPSEARAIVYSLSHDERPSVVVQENLLKPLFCKLHYRLQSHHDQKHVGGGKEVLSQAE